MRKKLALLVFALAAAAATTIPHAAEGIPCPRSGEHVVVCPTYSFCCPDNALCVCTP